MGNSKTKSFPKTLKEFGYGFNNDGFLRQINSKTNEFTDKKFEFNICDDRKRNQQHYEALGDSITEYIYELLEKEGLHRIYVPTNYPSSEATFVFSTKRDLSNVKKLLILIHGSGVVRAGQWARSLIINQSLNHGTQIPYIREAIKLGYDVLILNSNDNKRMGKYIPDHASPTQHAISIWSEFVTPANIEAIGIVAHSYGGVVTMDLAEEFHDEFKEKVFAVGLTDSVHSSMSKDIIPTMQKICRNWIASDKPINTVCEEQTKSDVMCLSSGHTKHEWTSWSAMDALFNFFEQQYEQFTENEPNNKKPKSEL